MSVKANQVSTGGRPAAQLDFVLMRGNIRACFHVLAFPGTPILRQWIELENSGAQPAVLASPASACWRLGGGEASSYTHSWMRGGRAGPDQGKLEQAPVASPYSRKLEGSGTAEWVPWTALHREDGPKDGWFMALEYLGRWSLSVDRAAAGPLAAAAVLPELKSIALQPGQRLGLPPVTFGVFHDGLDAMAASLYDWQYEYLWDYTNADFYARSRCLAWWFYCSQNLQEQFTARLANLDLNTSDAMRTMGYENALGRRRLVFVSRQRHAAERLRIGFRPDLRRPGLFPDATISAKDGHALALVVRGPSAGRGAGRQDRSLGRF